MMADSSGFHSSLSTATEQWTLFTLKTDYKDATKGEGEYTVQIQWRYHA